MPGERFEGKRRFATLGTNMEELSRAIVSHAQELAREVGARALVVYADALSGDDELSRLITAVNFPVILVTRTHAEIPPHRLGRHVWIRVPDVPMSRAGQVRTTLLVCLARGVLRKGDRIVCLSGADHSGVLDTILVLDLSGELEVFSLIDSEPCPGDPTPEVFERVLTLATQLAVEGREGRPVGALFALGDSERVLRQSRSLVLNPFLGHPESARNVLDPALEETIKEFSALDGAFVLRGDGVVLTAGSHLMPLSTAATELDGGLGTRHGAAAGISASTRAVAICISQSTGTVSVYKSGLLVTDIRCPHTEWTPSDLTAEGATPYYELAPILNSRMSTAAVVAFIRPRCYQLGVISIWRICGYSSLC